MLKSEITLHKNIYTYQALAIDKLVRIRGYGMLFWATVMETDSS